MVTGPVMQDCVEVFEVGKLQLWRWCEWCNHYSLETGCFCNADSLAKGRYAVVSNYAWFGGMQTKPTVWDSFGSLVSALGYIAELTEIYGGTRHCVESYEVWHIVDDNELWGDWERDVELSRFAQPLGDDVALSEITQDELREYTDITSDCPAYIDSDLRGFDRMVRQGAFVGQYLVVEHQSVGGVRLYPSVIACKPTSRDAARFVRERRGFDVAAGLADAGITVDYEIWHVTDTSDGSDPASDYWECVACGYRTDSEPDSEPEPTPPADFEIAISDEHGPLGSVLLRDAQAWQLLEYCRSLKEHGYDVRVCELRA